MWHINGLYTQRYNRLRRTDGPLFRGRYKAIVIDANAYLLQVSRYIHRNPIETTQPLVKRLEAYRWSSYTAYVNKAPVAAWLYRDAVYGELGSTHHYAAYRRYVADGIDEQMRRFYKKGQIPALLGDKAFAKHAYAKALSRDKEISMRGAVAPVEIRYIVSRVAKHFHCSERSIYETPRGRGPKNIPRWAAMRLCRDYSGRTLVEIGKMFGVGNYCTVSQTIARLGRLTETDERLRMQLDTISKDLTP